MTSTRHRWGEKTPVSRHKSEQQCIRCGTVMARRNEFEGGRELHWKEFWRDLERLDSDGKTPPCDARLEKRGQHDQQQISQQLHDGR
jgi:hypothetical protein